MYQFSPMSERIERLRDEVRNRTIIADASKAIIKAEAQAKYKDYPPVVQKPAETLYLIERMNVDIHEDEFFAGDMGNKHWGASNGDLWMMTGDIEKKWTLEEDGLYHAPLDDPFYSKQKFAIAPEDVKAFQELMKKKMQASGGVRPERWLPQGWQEVFQLGCTPFGKPGGDFMFSGSVLMPPGHMTPGFQHILARGYGDIRKQAQDWLDEHKGNVMGDDMSKYLFYSAAVLACDGAITLTKRFADKAREKIETAPTPEKKAEYEKMAVGLDRIAEGTPTTFWEACQMYMLYHNFLMLDNSPSITSLGRFDQTVWPYLKKDLEDGTITLPEAQELVDAFFLKLNLFYGGAVGDIITTAGLGTMGQHTTVGGCDKEGKDSTNPVTFMVLEAMARLELHEPTVSLRTTKDSPKELWDCAIGTSMRVGGLPLLQNDEVIIPGIMKELGFSLEDARDYSFIGCQEIVGSGNDYPAPNGSAAGINGIYWPIVLDMAINNGINPMNGKQAPAEYCSGYLYEMKSFDEVKAAFEKLATWLMTWIVTLNNYTEHEYPRLFPFPNVSISVDGCLEKGKDVSAGGAKYNSYGGTATGLATVSDSLTAIRYLVFDKKLVSAKEYLDAILADWEGYEPLRQRIINEVPHYGNADEYADAQHKYVMDLYYDMCRPYHNTRCKVYKCGMYGAADHVAQGHITWATPDGRKTGTPIADAMSPVQGRDTNGPTSVFLSTCCFDHSRYMDGMAVNMKIHPTALNGDAGVTKLEDMVQAYFADGGMEVQFNVVDAKTLRKAQANPEKYRNLVVRIAGYSTYFVDMTTDMQNDVISRAEHVF